MATDFQIVEAFRCGEESGYNQGKLDGFREARLEYENQIEELKLQLKACEKELDQALHERV